MKIDENVQKSDLNKDEVYAYSDASSPTSPSPRDRDRS